MSFWLFKEEPTHYAFGDLERDGATLWNGVSNNLARIHLRTVRRGDRIWFYHSGAEKAIVGEMVAVSDPVPDPTADAKGVAVEVKAVRRLLSPVLLSVVKDDPKLSAWELVRLPRLSVMPVTPQQWRRVEELSRGSPPKKQGAGK